MPGMLPDVLPSLIDEIVVMLTTHPLAISMLLVGFLGFRIRAEAKERRLRELQIIRNLKDLGVEVEWIGEMMSEDDGSCPWMRDRK